MSYEKFVIGGFVQTILVVIFMVALNPNITSNNNPSIIFALVTPLGIIFGIWCILELVEAKFEEIKYDARMESREEIERHEKNCKRR